MKVRVISIDMCSECPYKTLVYMESESMYADGVKYALVDGHVECVHYHTCKNAMEKMRDVIMGATANNA